MGGSPSVPLSDSGEETFDYSQMYRQFGTSADPEEEFFEDAFGKEAKMDGIARQDWLDYIGPAAPAYLAAYSRMQLQKSKVSMSFSALLFGPFYFFYRKSAADHIRRIQSEFPDAQQRQAVLRAQGGVSFGAVFLCVLLLSVCGSAFTLLLGPDLQAILNAFYG